jgi:hypothetical protein
MNPSSVKYLGHSRFLTLFPMFRTSCPRLAEAVETGERIKIERPVLLLRGHAALFGVHVNISMG